MYLEGLAFRFKFHLADLALRVRSILDDNQDNILYRTLPATYGRLKQDREWHGGITDERDYNPVLKCSPRSYRQTLITTTAILAYRNIYRNNWQSITRDHDHLAHIPTLDARMFGICINKRSHYLHGSIFKDFNMR